ncbi:MAG: M1 family aminopeptidase [Bacteroidota bacterium]
MKKTYSLLLLTFVSFVFAQSKSSEFEQLVASEMRSASTNFTELAVNPNTLNYDITYHKLEFTINPNVSKFVAGKITTTYTAVSDMNTVTFDFANALAVTSVMLGTTSLTFLENANNELVISLPATQLAGTSATVEIIYSGVPPTNGFDSFVRSTHNGVGVIWTLSEPFGARDWWPCKQDLNDKINSIDVYITAPSQFVSVANGIETTAPVIVGGNKTTHFHHNYPIPAYLIAIACTNYSVYNQMAGTAPTQFPIINYVYPENLAGFMTDMDQTPLIMDFFETLFEPYPFRNEKYGHAQFGWGGGMEHTTVSFMTNFSRGLIAHEMAHQWFGDKITCGTWKDIWLNEGFATFVAALVIENFDGAAAYVDEKDGMITNITSQPNGNVYLTEAQSTNVNRIFSGRLSYNKGAMVLEMLRFKMGDTQFFQAIRNYLADTNLAYKYAVTTDLKSHLETVYGSSLTEFFNDWIYNEGYPIYNITAQNIEGGQVSFVVNQTQSDASVTYFEMPVPVRVFGTGGQQMDLVLENTFNDQTIVKNVPFNITSLEFDPNKHLISKNSTVTLSNHSFELENAIVVYPNPVIDELHVQIPTSVTLEKVIVYNSLGQKVAEGNNPTISIATVSSGVLFVEITTAQGTFHKKIIKK